MSYATLMVYVELHRMPEEKVRLAAHLANKFNAVLIGLSALPIGGPVVAGGVLVADTSPTDLKEVRAKLADEGTGFATLLAPFIETWSGETYWTFRPLHWRGRHGLRIYLSLGSIRLRGVSIARSISVERFCGQAVRRSSCPKG